MSGVKPRYEGGAYIRVYVNGQEFSKHTSSAHAADRANDVGMEALRALAAGEIAAFPLIYTQQDGRIVYEPDPSDTSVTLPPAPPGTVASDGGVDLVEFLETSGKVPPATSTLTGSDWGTIVPEFAAKHDDLWLHWLWENGKLAAATWLGFVLVTKYRRRSWLRIGRVGNEQG